MASEREVRELLEDRPDLEPAVEAVLEPEPPWGFDDVPVDSGAFGELVNAGVVERTGEGYRVADSIATGRALAAEAPPASSSTPSLPDLAVAVDWPRLGLLTAAVLTVVLVRLVPIESVYYRGHVVLSGNDPYFYRYWVERLLADPATGLDTLPGGVLKGEPLLVATLWAGSLLLGGTPWAAGTALAWYPVATAAMTAVLVYLIAVTVTDDRRIALASVLMLAVLPGHAMRTGLGFGDHHAFDYLWLTLTVFGLVLVGAARRESRPRRTIVGVGAIGIGVTAQTLAWDSSPLLVAPLLAYFALEAVRAVHAEESPLRTLGPSLAGLAAATTIVWTAHSRLGWHTELVVVAPLLVLGAGLAVAVLGEGFRRAGLPALGLAGAVGVLVGVELFALRAFRPSFWARLTTSVEGRLLARRPIAEVQSIVSDSAGWLLLFGFLLVLAVPYLVWATRRIDADARWLAPVTYAWYFLGLAVIQARFVGELSPTIAVFAGFGFVHLAERIDVAGRPAPFTDAAPTDLRIPELDELGYLVVLFLLLAGLSVMQVPVLTSMLTTPSELSDTAFYLADYSEDRGLEHPENYVFSSWGENRAYNYFVNGESRSYGYAQTNFAAFRASTDPGSWYDRLSGRAGFVVTTSGPDLEPSQLGAVLHRDNGSRTVDHPGVGHYRLLYVSESGRYKAFALVDGALLSGQTEPNATVTARTAVDVQGATFTYVREATADESGNYRLRLAHPGSYEVAGQTVTVSEQAVRNGSVVDIGSDRYLITNGLGSRTHRTVSGGGFSG